MANKTQIFCQITKVLVNPYFSKSWSLLWPPDYYCCLNKLVLSQQLSLFCITRWPRPPPSLFLPSLVEHRVLSSLLLKVDGLTPSPFSYCTILPAPPLLIVTRWTDALPLSLKEDGLSPPPLSLKEDVSSPLLIV